MKRIVSVERSADGDAVVVRFDGLTNAEARHLAAVLANRSQRFVRSLANAGSSGGK